jgi:hypothetical protein
VKSLGTKSLVVTIRSILLLNAIYKYAKSLQVFTNYLQMKQTQISWKSFEKCQVKKGLGWMKLFVWFGPNWNNVKQIY